MCRSQEKIRDPGPELSKYETWNSPMFREKQRMLSLKADNLKRIGDPCKESKGIWVRVDAGGLIN